MTNTYNSNSSTHGLAWKVSPELGPDSTTVAMWTNNLTPNDPQTTGLVMSRASSQPTNKRMSNQLTI